MRMVPAILAFAFSAIVNGCTTTDDPASATGEEEYVITSRQSGATDGRYFQATDILTKKSHPIAAIQETTGRVYTAIMSSYPECQRKVVQGLVSGDSLFITTKVVRDTTIPTVGI